MGYEFMITSAKVFERVLWKPRRDVVSFDESGKADVLKVERREIPTLKDDQVLIKVAATTVTEYDLWRRAFRKSVHGLHELLGMECSGEIVAVGSSVREYCVYDKVCALLQGGGYAEYVAVESWRVLPIPNGIRLEEAATLPYTTSVVWLALFRIGKLKDGCSILVHGGAGEFGQLAIQLALLHGCTVFVSSRVDLIFDNMSSPVVENLKILSRGGTLIITSFSEVSNVHLDLGLLEKKQINLSGFILKYASVEDQKEILQEIFTNVWPSFESGNLVQKVNKRLYTFSEAPEAHVAWANYQCDRILLIPTSSPSNRRKRWWSWFL